VTNGELRQSGDTAGDDIDPVTPDKPGTYALAGDPGWGDYRLAVRLRSDTEGGIGVLFRYQDADNYYRFSMDAAGSFRRLVKKAAGTVSILWEDSIAYTVGREYLLTIDCIGERLVGYIDGIRLFAVEDGEVASGTIGLYCWANSGARFAEVRVATADWFSYYVFGREDTLHAGTQLRLLAGNETEMPASEPGIIHRFAASLDDPGRVRLPADGVDLRVRAPNAMVGHARRFLPELEYTKIEALALRKADGTGIFFVAPAATPTDQSLPEGQYRIQMTYLRDNTDNEPRSQVFSEGGISTEEEVVIDVPWELQ
jgi:hypothetical protein